MNKSRLITALTIPLIAMLVVVPGWNQIAAAPRPGPRPPRLTRDGAPGRQMYIEKILGVLEHKVADPTFRTRAAVRTWVSEAAWLVVGAAERAVRVVTDRLSLFYHVVVVILSAAIAATLPFTFAFLAQRLLASWSAIEDEKIFLVLTEIAVALVLVLVLSHARTNWTNRRLSRMARAAGMVHLSLGNGVLSQLSARRLKQRHASMRDVMIMGSTGFRTLVDPQGDLHTVIENCRTAKIMLLDPESQGAIERVRTIGEHEITRDDLRTQVE